jgi:hypothetical protein
LNFADFSQLREIPVAWTTRTKMIEPFFGFRERHPFRSDPRKDVRAGAAGTLRIGKLFEQTSAQCIQDALFVRSRVSSRVQVRLTSSATERMYIQ